MEAKDLQLLEAGLGNVTWWGYSPAFNILEKMDPSTTGRRSRKAASIFYAV